MGLRTGISIGIRKKHIRIGNKFDCVEGVTCNVSNVFSQIESLQVDVESRRNMGWSFVGKNSSQFVDVTKPWRATPGYEYRFKGSFP